jgi:hypothetical protein
MSENSKTRQMPTLGEFKVLRFHVDIMAIGSGVAAYAIPGATLPKDHDVVHCDVYWEEALTSAGSNTISFGFDSSSDPDNLLDDTAKASCTVNTKVAGIPRMGTAATAVAVGTSDAQLYYGNKVASATAGKATLIVTLLPTR